MPTPRTIRNSSNGRRIAWRAPSGQTKPCALLREKRVVIPNRAVDLAIEGADQIILEKQHFSLFTNPNSEALIRSLGPDECIVYGVVTEICVKQCVDGLRERGYKVRVVQDAVQSLSGQTLI